MDDECSHGNDAAACWVCDQERAAMRGVRKWARRSRFLITVGWILCYLALVFVIVGYKRVNNDLLATGEDLIEVIHLQRAQIDLLTEELDGERTRRAIAEARLGQRLREESVDIRFPE